MCAILDLLRRKNKTTERDKYALDEVWSNIRKFEGQEFRTIKGLPFTYSLQNDIMTTSRTAYQITKKDFEIANAVADLRGPGQISRKVRGSSYVYGILADARIR